MDKKLPTPPPELTADQVLLEVVLAALRVHGLQAELQTRKARIDNRQKADARLRLRFGEVKLNPFVEIKRTVTPATLGGVAQQVRRLGPDAMLLLDYATPPVAEQLRAMGIPFADTAGNIWLNHPPLLLWVTGRKPPEEFRRGAPVGRAFQESGLKLIFALLCHPEWVGHTYRELAEHAAVAHGTVGWVMADLAKQRHLVVFGKGKAETRKLRDRRRLLDDWCVAYARTLRPKILNKIYQWNEMKHWQTFDFYHKYNMQLGGEAAAALMTKYLQPEIITLYAANPNLKFVVDEKLTPATHGNVEILEKFWNYEVDGAQYKMVPPILVYADLLATGDPRCLETARMIYDEHLAGYFGKI